LEVPHVHLHVIPLWQMADLDFARADHSPQPADMDDAAERLRAALRKLGHSAEVPSS
jgi:diadenosine tetraphosphate (Ap4A) HIT family hydrolase